MIINTANLKNENILQNNTVDTNGNPVTARGISEGSFGVQFETTRDKYVHRGFAMCGIEDITYSKEDNKKAVTGDEEGTVSILDSIEGMKEQLNAIVNQVGGIGYREARELFGISDDTDVRGIVTVVEKIQIKLAAALGEDYKGMASIDAKDVEAVMGTSAVAGEVADSLNKYSLPLTEDNAEQIKSALDTLEQFKEMTKEQAQYLVKNGLEPTIANIYKAQNSAGEIYSGIPLTDADWEQLKPQVAEVVTEAFGETENMDYLMLSGKWMIEHGLELNAENLKQFVEIDSMRIGELVPDKKHVISRMTQAIAMGHSASDAKLTGNEFSAEYVEEVIKRRQLEEVRLMMTKEAGLSLLKKGIDIDTAELELLVEELKKQEDMYYRSLAELEHIEITEHGIGVLKDTARAVEALKMAPAYIIGGVVKEEFSMTVAESVKAGEKMISAMSAEALRGYETLMTRPEREYGDNITKAFRNVDALLHDIGLEDTEENNRAVRILAYNEMAITPENVSAVSYEDSEYQYLLKNLTPRMVLHCIKEGINPLDMNIHELNDVLEGMQNELGSDKEERFSEFLWRLDKTGSISAEDREAYIGLYRLLNTINRTDGAAIGALVNQGAEVTLNNLLMATRTKKHHGMDIKLDEELSFTDRRLADNSITEQLKFFYDDSWKEEYENYKKEEYQSLMGEEEALRLIAEEGQTPTINTMKAASLLLLENGHLFDKYLGLPKNANDKTKKEELLKISELLGDKEALDEAYEKLGLELGSMIEGYEEAADAAYDTLEDMRVLYAGFRFISATARENESYHIPVEIDGRVTNVRLKIVRGEAETGVINIRFKTEEFGSVRAEFKIKGGMLEGFIVSDIRAGVDRLKGKETSLGKALEKYDITFGRIDYAVSFFEESSVQRAHAKESVPVTDVDTAVAQDKVSTEILYGVAKEFIEQLG